MAGRDLRAKLLAEADSLRPYEELVRSKGFQQWRAHIEQELKMLENFSWSPVSVSKPVLLQKAMSELGLVIPTTTAEMHECWLAFRSARNFMKAKFGWLDVQVRKLEGAQARLARLDKGV